MKKVKVKLDLELAYKLEVLKRFFKIEDDVEAIKRMIELAYDVVYEKSLEDKFIERKFLEAQRVSIEEITRR